MNASAGAAERWLQLLAELEKTHGALAQVLGRHGAPPEESPDRLVLRLGALTPEEERLVNDKRNQRACAEAATRVFGRALVLAVGGGVPRPAAESRRTELDPLTRRMVQDYEGTVEELS